MTTKAENSEAINVGDLFSVKGKTALVTGGSRGIGLMIARGYVEAGARVYISSRKKEVCDAAARELSAVGSCVSLPADISSEEGWLGLAREIGGREQALHILVNNAGTTWGRPIADFPASGFDKVFDLNVKAMFMLTRELLPLLERAATAEDPARVINIGSIDGIKPPLVENFSYSASKAAVHQMTRVLAGWLGPRRITVNAIAPGPFETKMTEWMFDNYLEQIIAHCALGRVGRPADMAGIAIYLASRAGAYLNGTITPVDGGIAAK